MPKISSVEVAGDELDQLVFAHRVGGAFGSGCLFELGCFAEVVHELLLDGAAACDVNFFRVHQMVADLFEILLSQSFLEVVGGVLTRVCTWTRVFCMTDDGERSGFGIVTNDCRVVSVHPDTELLFSFFRHEAPDGRMD